MEVELMVTKRDDRPTDQQGEYRAICLGKVGRQSFAIAQHCSETQIGDSHSGEASSLYVPFL